MLKVHMPSDIYAPIGPYAQAIVADGPAMLLINKEHGGQQLLGGHLGLGPARAVIVGIEDMASITT